MMVGIEDPLYGVKPMDVESDSANNSNKNFNKGRNSTRSLFDSKN